MCAPALEAGPYWLSACPYRLLWGRVLWGQIALRSRRWAGCCAHLSLGLAPPSPQLFDIRPIWSRNAVRAKMSVHPDKLKVLLPFMAYYMVSVWRSAHAGPQDGLSEPEQAALSILPTPPKTSTALQEHTRPAGVISGLKRHFKTLRKGILHL